MEKRDMLTAKDIRRAAELLEKDSGKVLKVEGILEVEYPKVRTDFLMPKENEEMIINKFKRKETISNGR